MKQTRVQITERDAAVLSWLEHVRVAATDTMAAAYSYFGDSPMIKQAVSRRLVRMANAGHFGSAELQRGNNRRVYWPASSPYPTTRRELPHDLIAAHMSIMLLEATTAEFLAFNRTLSPPSREQPRKWTQDMPSTARGHRADGLLWLPDNTAVIVEIELTAKSARKMASILTSHTDRLADPDDPAAHVLYLTTQRVGEHVARAWRKLGHAADHPAAMQIIHAIDDTTLNRITTVATIPIPAA